MTLLRFRQAAAIVTALFLILSLTPASFAQATGDDKVDLDALAQIKTEAIQHSQVMENLFWMSEVYGPRVTNSRNHKLAAGLSAVSRGGYHLAEKCPFRRSGAQTPDESPTRHPEGTRPTQRVRYVASATSQNAVWANCEVAGGLRDQSELCTSGRPFGRYPPNPLKVRVLSFRRHNRGDALAVRVRL